MLPYKHCVIITVYKHLDAVNMLCKYLPSNFTIYVHLDKNFRYLKKDIDTRANVFSFYRIYWGAYEHLASIVKILSIAANGDRYDYYHIITGQDFIAMNPNEFEKILSVGEKNYLDIFPLPRKGWWGDGLDIFRYRTVSSLGDVRSGIPARIDRKLRKLFEFAKRHNLTRRLPDFPLYGGSVYCSLSVGFVNWLLSDKTAKRFLKSLKHTLCAEEIFFQTLIMLSPFRETVIKNQLRYIKWVNGTPKILTEEDLEKALNQGFLFCRKVASQEMISRICDSIGMSNNGRE